MLKAYREDRIWLMIVVINIVSLIGFGWFLSHRLGTEGMAWAHYLMLGHLLMAWRVYRICGPAFWRLAGELLLVYLLPLPFFLTISYLLPPATWGRFAASLLAVLVIGLVLVARLRRPFQEFFFSSETPQ